MQFDVILSDMPFHGRPNVTWTDVFTRETYVEAELAALEGVAQGARDAYVEFEGRVILWLAGSDGDVEREPEDRRGEYTEDVPGVSPFGDESADEYVERVERVAREAFEFFRSMPWWEEV
jgi:hypothetical protein